MIKSLAIEEFLTNDPEFRLADVRTPAEFMQGHVPGAFNLPLFSNEERVKVGTTYKQVGREAAILLGFDLAGPKWSGFIREAVEKVPEKKIAVHCWRGGMRSAAMAWALDLYGFEVAVINGGYKQYRRWALAQFEITYNLIVLGGMTGSGKTRILQQFSTGGEPVIDLERLANHRGSTYGSMDGLQQPTQEQFENDLALELSRLDKNKSTWVEDESSSIGRRIIPRPFWNQLLKAPLIDLQIPSEQRVESLVNEYGRLDPGFLEDSTERIRKRLGHEHTQHAINAIREDRMADFIRIVIHYYDKTYRTGLAKRDPSKITTLIANTTDAITNANLVRSSILEKEMI